eukprot:TRINITY_DN12423_c0_g1_i1.p1 TRINITY_DN12423_c0_g1~~TRINITY_DN12423_c0_g1_i1.p1  ORF type:complete len:202 (+),score=53.32 TRINITY_DN12423_c0_g1_i1:17-622(+)
MDIDTSEKKVRKRSKSKKSKKDKKKHKHKNKDKHSTRKGGKHAQRKKRKREEEENSTEPDTTNPPLKKAKRAPKAPAPKRYLLFIGNLPYDITEEELFEHFEAFKANIIGIRIPYDQKLKRCKGFCFLEVTDPDTFNKALNYHHSLLRERKIRVQLTAGGGGNSVNRRTKIKAKNHALADERRKAYNEREKNEKKSSTKEE